MVGVLYKLHLYLQLSVPEEKRTHNLYSVLETMLLLDLEGIKRLKKQSLSLVSRLNNPLFTKKYK